MTESEEREFLHDIINPVTIASGRLRQIKKLTVDEENSEKKNEVLHMIESADQAMKRLTLLVQERRSKMNNLAFVNNFMENETNSI